jgi:predicted component of type VI protein secretion system
VAVFKLSGNDNQHSVNPRPTAVRSPASVAKAYKSPERRTPAAPASAPARPTPRPAPTKSISDAPAKSPAPKKGADEEWETF